MGEFKKLVTRLEDLEVRLRALESLFPHARMYLKPTTEEPDDDELADPVPTVHPPK